MITASTSVKTEFAKRYLGQLCKHFAHKISVDYLPEETTPQGVAHFPWGDCIMSAESDALSMTVTAETSAAVERVQAVLDDHLTRFAWREELTIEWSATPN